MKMALSISNPSLVLLTVSPFCSSQCEEKSPHSPLHSIIILNLLSVVTTLQIPEQIFTLSKTVGALPYWILPWSRQQNKIDHFLVSGFQTLVLTSDIGLKVGLKETKGASFEGLSFAEVFQNLPITLMSEVGYIGSILQNSKKSQEVYEYKQQDPQKLQNA